jgi:hypothetical protein
MGIPSELLRSPAILHGESLNRGAQVKLFLIGRRRFSFSESMLASQNSGYRSVFDALLDNSIPSNYAGIYRDSMLATCAI